MKRIFLNHPSLSNLEKKHVLDVIKSKWLSSKGKHTKILLYGGKSTAFIVYEMLKNENFV